jgi:hypothetical protein
MNKSEEKILAELKDSVGKKDPLEYFANIVNVFSLMLSKLDSIQLELKKVKTNSSLSINWDPKLASALLLQKITELRESQDKELFKTELDVLKTAYSTNIVTKDYNTFVQFWTDLLGYHPFLE